MAINILDSMIINRIWMFMSCNSVFYLTKDLTYKMNKISQSSLDNAGSGVFTTRLYGDVSIVANAPLTIVDFATSALSAIGFVTYVLTLSVWVGLYVVVYLLSTLFLEFYRINTRQKNTKVMRKVGEKESSLRNENIRGIKDLRGINATYSLSDKSLELTKEKGEYNLASSYKLNTIRVVIGIIKYILDFSLIAMCVYLIVQKKIELATFLIIYNFRGRISNFSSYIVSMKDYSSDLCLSAQRLNEIFDENKYPSETFGCKDLENFEGRIEFKDVKFSYGKEELVLDGVNFKIIPNTVTSFVGLSGSGKSTIISLMNKIYPLAEGGGEILFDDVNINDLTEESLRTSVCTISQSPYIFNMSIEENLKLAKQDATEEEINEVLKAVNILDFVKTLPNGIKSKLGENGIKVSGGQKQRIAIARAMLTNSKVMLFDEATSALDNINQKHIKDIVDKLKKTRTIVLVAHRLSTVVDSDNIIVIKEGKVFAQGTHEELMKNCEYYHNLYIEEDLKEQNEIKE